MDYSERLPCFEFEDGHCYLLFGSLLMTFELRDAFELTPLKRESSQTDPF